ncbi:hypothetical protein ALNOE001_14870 [Candidatus Methanobinarius endosymbioticus]|uniref:Uncharacterized protein n=1 Tax=Candidatus Methanobinarius endosymbioticus TaxID=2006182 RepID=A0A366MB24_9EURY|nr:hypothetical protein ALNOE001_14870 [Candidatus Methanobinarius endosymbioticus]
MLKHYPKDFANEIADIFHKNLEEYKKYWILYHHETQFFHFTYETINEHELKFKEIDEKRYI